MDNIPEEALFLIIQLNNQYPDIAKRIRNIWGLDKKMTDNIFLDIMTLNDYNENKPHLSFGGWDNINKLHNIHRGIYGFVDRNQAIWHLPV
jgi:hypothetical protein